MLATFLLVFGFLASAGADQALAQTDTFLNMGTIKGSSTDVRHRDWIDVISLTQTLEISQSSARGGQAGRHAACSLEVIKHLDIAGPLLWSAAVTGQVFREVQIDVSSQGGNPRVFYQIKLRNAMITGISTVGNGGYGERLSMAAESVELGFRAQKPDGSFDAPVVSTFAC
jgi:type VI secretion system secreted protein Hcp